MLKEWTNLCDFSHTAGAASITAEASIADGVPLYSASYGWRDSITSHLLQLQQVTIHPGPDLH